MKINLSILAIATIATLGTIAGLSCPADAQTTLSGAVIHTTGQGSYWNTQGSDFAYNLYLNNGSSFINSGNDTSASISQLLTPGTYTYSFYGDTTTGNSGMILNLYFNGSTTASISALTPSLGATSAPTAYSGSVYNLGCTSSSAGANTTVFNNGQTRIELTEFSYTNPGTDTVSSYSITPSGSPDTVGRFTLQVSSVAVPEPGALTLLSLPGIGMILVRRAKRRG